MHFNYCGMKTRKGYLPNEKNTLRGMASEIVVITHFKEDFIALIMVLVTIFRQHGRCIKVPKQLRVLVFCKTLSHDSLGTPGYGL